MSKADSIKMERNATEKSGVQHRKRFTTEEDIKLVKLVNQFGTNNWEQIKKLMPKRTERQLKDRWMHYLSPNVKNSDWTEDEDKIILEKYEIYGPQWNMISKLLENRSCIGVRNRAKKLLSKRKTQEIENDEDFSEINTFIDDNDSSDSVSSPAPDHYEDNIFQYIKKNFIDCGIDTVQTITVEIQSMSTMPEAVDYEEF